MKGHAVFGDIWRRNFIQIKGEQQKTYKMKFCFDYIFDRQNYTLKYPPYPILIVVLWEGRDNNFKNLKSYL